MDTIGGLLILMAAGSAPQTSAPAAPARNVQRVEATVTIIAAETIDVRTPLPRGNSQATSRQYRERDKRPLVEFF